MNYGNDSAGYANQQAMSAVNSAVQGLAGIRQNTIETIHSDCKSRLDSLLKQCAQFEQLKAENQLRLAEVNQLRTVLEILERPLAMPPEAGR